jgi:hypothetical protein
MLLISKFWITFLMPHHFHIFRYKKTCGFCYTIFIGIFFLISIKSQLLISNPNSPIFLNLASSDTILLRIIQSSLPKFNSLNNWSSKIDFYFCEMFIIQLSRLFLDKFHKTRYFYAENLMHYAVASWEKHASILKDRISS